MVNGAKPHRNRRDEDLKEAKHGIIVALQMLPAWGHLGR